MPDRLGDANRFWSTLAVGHMDLISEYRDYLQEAGALENTINTYLQTLYGYQSWYVASFGADTPCAFLRLNLLDYSSYLTNVKKRKAETVNNKLAALHSFNAFLIERGILKDFVLTKRDRKKTQVSYASPCKVTQQAVDEFRQRVLVGQGARDYAIVTLLAYAGLRISELVMLELNDVNLNFREILVRHGKGDKERVVRFGHKVANALKEYLKVRPQTESPYFFISRHGGHLDRSRVNQICNAYSDVITPHQLRHFFCSHAMEGEKPYSIAEVANQAGHSSVQTTLRYTHPSQRELAEKADQL